MAVDILIVNLTRLGDLLQCQALIDDLNLSSHTVGLVCLENFAGAAAMLRGVKRVWPFPGAKLLAVSDASWPTACEDVLNFAEKTRVEASQRVTLNLTPGLPARLLTSLLAGPDGRRLGFDLDPYGYGVNASTWASFFAAAARKRMNAPFNVADMARGLAISLTGALRGDFRLAPPPAEALEKAEELLKSAPLDAGFVAFQLGASEERRRWPVRSFAALGDRLYRESGLTPVLLGSASETKLAEEYATAAKEPFVDLVGKTDLQTLAAVLTKTRLLVTNDTGTMHLASGVGVPCLAFFLATAQPADTGPLLPGSLALEPALPCHPCPFGEKCSRAFACRDAIGADTAFELISAWLQTGAWPEKPSRRAVEECRAWLTEKDADGFTRARPLFAPENDERVAWYGWTREFWTRALADLATANGGNSIPAAYSSTPAPDAESARSVAATLGEAAILLDSIGECAVMIGKTSMGGKLFLRNCERLQTLLDNRPRLASLAAFWREYRQNQGDDLDKFLPGLRVLSGRVKEFAEALNSL